VLRAVLLVCVQEKGKMKSEAAERISCPRLLKGDGEVGRLNLCVDWPLLHRSRVEHMNRQPAY
jgi:hypothetical protein